MSRFNLWEKFLIENEEYQIEDKTEEMEDSLQELMVNFILNLPEDSIPEDMRANYDTIVAQIGDDYLGANDENIDDYDATMFDDEELAKDKMEEARIQFTVELPSGTRIVLKNDAERKRAASVIKYYTKDGEKIGDKEMMKIIALAIKMKGANMGEVKKTYDAVSKGNFDTIFTKE